MAPGLMRPGFFVPSPGALPCPRTPKRFNDDRAVSVTSCGSTSPFGPITTSPRSAIVSHTVGLVGSDSR